MAIKVKQVGKSLVTPGQAAEMLEHNRYSRQRQPSVERVALYTTSMAEDSFPPGSTLVFANLDGQRLLMDGQKRLMALYRSGKVIEFVVVEYECDSDDDVAELYYTIDTQQSRSLQDMYRALDMESKTGLALKYVAVAGRAAAFIENNFIQPRDLAYTKMQLLGWIAKYETAINDYYTATNVRIGKIHNLMWRTSVAAVGMVSFYESAQQFDYGRIADFWGGIVLDSGLTTGDPRKVLRDFLLVSRVARHRFEVKSNEFVSHEYTSRYVANCLNSWLQDKTFSEGGRRAAAARVMDQYGPIKILGSRFTGKEPGKERRQELEFND